MLFCSFDQMDKIINNFGHRTDTNLDETKFLNRERIKREKLEKESKKKWK